MTNKDLFKEAIADAKAVREAALVNAKAALEEAFAPKLQSMISAKLQEMEEYEMEEEGELEENIDEYMKEDELEENYEEEYEMEEGFLGAREAFDNENPDFNLFEEEEDELEEDFDLSEILAELDGKEEDELEEAKKKKKKKSEEEDIEGEEKEEETNSSKKAKKASKETYPLEEEEDEDDAKISSLTVSELKDLISDIIHGEMEHEENETPSDEEHEPEHGGEEDQDEVDLEELLAELDEMDYEEMEEKIEPRGYKSDGKFKGDPKSSEELKEAIKTINTLRKELNEQNLLNAKLLYVNKIFKAKNLTESQKLRVIASFDKATTAKEAKMVFESLNTTLKTNAPKNSLKESMGFASKASGVAPKKAIVESDDVITRMQKLANIIK
jgi:hypothetical protein